MFLVGRMGEPVLRPLPICQWERSIGRPAAQGKRVGLQKGGPYKKLLDWRADENNYHAIYISVTRINRGSGVMSGLSTVDRKSRMYGTVIRVSTVPADIWSHDCRRPRGAHRSSRWNQARWEVAVLLRRLRATICYRPQKYHIIQSFLSSYSNKMLSTLVYHLAYVFCHHACQN
jgi:hypothetical protein